MSFRKPPTEPQSAVFASARTRDPRVTQPASRWTMVLGVSGLVILAVGVFTSLSQARTARQADDKPAAVSQGPDITTARSFRLAQATTEAPPVPTGPELPVYGGPPGQGPAPYTPTATPGPVTGGLDGGDAALRAPAMVVELADNAAGQMAQARAAASTLSADERFAARVSGGGSETARATQLGDLTRIVPQGAMIPAVLETAIDSDLPGQVRAVVSRDVRSYDGSQVLIPRGSKLIGQYRSAAAIGQTRAFVVWSRLLTPSGVAVDIGSPATDRLGRGGLDGKVDTHFFRRFGASVLLSVISAGLDYASRGDNGASNNTLIIGSPVQASRVAEIALSKQIDIPTTIRVPPGAAVQVSVARDLDFSGVQLAGR